jgi:transposase
VVLKFLPLYSPDFNPVKELFLILKAWVRRNREIEESFKDFSDFLSLTIEDFIKGKDAQGYFRLCRIGVKSESNINVGEN